MSLTVTQLLVTVLVCVVVGVCAFKVGARKNTRHTLASELLPPAPTRNSNLPTLTDRWVMEQEHELYPDRTFNHKGCRVCGPGPLGRWEVPSAYDHVYYNQVQDYDFYSRYYLEHIKVTDPARADVVSSEIEGHPGWHTVMLDLDFPARLVESSTPGHFHLYADKPMQWTAYKKLLKALADADFIEKGFLKASLTRRATHLRPPWVEKEAAK